MCNKLCKNWISIFSLIIVVVISVVGFEVNAFAADTYAVPLKKEINWNN